MDDVPQHRSRDLVPMPVNRRREFIEALAEKARVWVGRAGTVTVSQEDDSAVLFLAPIVDTAAPVWVVATEWIDIQVGAENSSRWELTYSDDHMASVGDLVRGVIEGGATEFRAFGRSRVRVSTLRGDLWSRRGRESVWGLIPAPGWQRWGKRHTFTRYAAKGSQ